RVWDWVNKYGHIIDNQHRRLGASCDWSRKTFTLDPGPAHAVRTTFKNLYDKGLIYRGERMINWCVGCRTALSDLEVDHFDEQGNLYHIRYALEDGSGHLTVATTRPETLLGDTAVAVNPNDERYTAFRGKRLLLPVLGRAIPIVEDEAVSMEFGTGALKITPGHDPNDFETGQRHGLPIINVLNPDGTLNAEAGPYEGQERFAARKAIVEQLEREGLLEKIEPHTHAVGHCQRSRDIVEPIISLQWFVNVEPLAKRALEVVRDGRIQIVPDRFEKVYANWMENLRDWCISRQLWWGHRIPVWYCPDGHETVAIEDPAACAQCGSTSITQDEDVLDTWFSSGLWPHSTLGWPEKNPDLDYFYPTSVMETAYDILFFWVARMVMLGLENMDDVPFRTVLLSGLIRDAQGQKMSKTRGNTIDPLESIKDYGTDALRFALTIGTGPGNDTRLSPDKLQAARNFANKLWNVSRFVLTNLEGNRDLADWHDSPPREHREDRWILGRLDQVTVEVQRLWDAFQLGEIERLLHDFIWSEYADWYIELAKVRLRNGDEAPRMVLAHVLERSLRLLHPFMPFITEELWQHLTTALPAPMNGLAESIMLAPYPAPSANAPDEQALA
ncbi:MAG: valine--tRNA ligase, partial [Dehalococcoidia bacterium]